MSDGKDALFVTSELGTIVKIAKVDETFLIGGTSKTIAGINFIPGSSAQGNGGYVHELGVVNQTAAIAFVLSFANSDEAVVLSTIK